MKQKIDYLIVGQGLAGSLLSWELIKRQKRVVILENENVQSSSKTAAGLINPITGKNIIKTWMADEIFPYIHQYYAELETFFGTQFLYKYPIYRVFKSIGEQNDWMGKSANEVYKNWIDDIYFKSRNMENIDDNFGGIVIKRGGFVLVVHLLNSLKKWFNEKNNLVYTDFEANKLKVCSSHIEYENFEAEKIIFCDGTSIFKNSNYWNFLPFNFVKGEILDIEIENNINFILNGGFFLIPKHNFVTIGTTYDRENKDWIVTNNGINTILTNFTKIYKGKYKIINSWAGLRPTTMDRRPIMGTHQNINSLGIFNGFGTKGVSLIPYFANEFCDFLINDKKINAEVDINRFLNSK